MGVLSFLKTATVEEIVNKGRTGTTGPRKQRNPNPTFIGIRIWKDGSVYPSQAAVDKFDLEYRGGKYETIAAIPAVGKEGDKDYKAAKPAVRKFIPADGTRGNGFDVIDSRLWERYKGEGNVIFLGLVPKDQSKVDLFGSTKYDAEGKPTTTVLDQGSATYGKDNLVPMIKEVYGIELNDEKEYVDLAIAEEVEGVKINEAFGKEIIFSPKKIARGEAKGKEDYERRENMPLYLLVPQEVLEGTKEEGTGTQEIEKTPQDTVLASSNGVMV